MSLLVWFCCETLLNWIWLLCLAWLVFFFFLVLFFLFKLLAMSKSEAWAESQSKLDAWAEFGSESESESEFEFEAVSECKARVANLWELVWVRLRVRLMRVTLPFFHLQSWLLLPCARTCCLQWACQHYSNNSLNSDLNFNLASTITITSEI